MRILVFSWRDPKHPTAGGAEQVMHEHLKGWVAAGHKVTLFSSRFPGSLAKENVDGIKLVHQGDQYIGVKLAAFVYYLKNKDSFDLVVDQFHGIPFFTPLYINKPRLAVLQEVAGKVWFLNEFPFPLNYLVGLLGYLAEPIIFLFYKRIPFLVGSSSAKIDLVKMGIPVKNITVVPHGVIVYPPKLFSKKEKIKTIVFLGALARDKGIEDALKTFALLNKKGNFQFWIVGKGSPEYVKKLKIQSSKLKIRNKTKFWGYVSQEKKFELLAKSHLLINPSIHEGWGLVDIEANSKGTPVVAYNSAGLTDSVKDGQSGVICKGNTPDFMAKEVMTLINNRNLYKKLQEGAIAWSKKFSWSTSRKKSLDLIDSLAS